MTNGIIYIASNNVGGMSDINYIQEFQYSVKSLKQHNPEINVTLFTDKLIESPLFDVKIVNMSIRCKQQYLQESPYNKTLYLDTDTYINKNIMDLFELLDKYEILITHDFARKRIFPIPEYMKIPNGFSEANGGVIAYKKCDNFNNMIKLWNHYYKKYKHISIWDQPSFRIALWESNINLYMLPTEYNRRSRETKKKCIKLRKNDDSRFNNNHLKTRIFHFHNLQKLNDKDREELAQVI